jgi:hypothetical protein
MRTGSWAALALAAVLACGAGLPAEARGEDWPAYQHDSSHTGRSGASFDPRDARLGWSAPRGYATPVVVGQTVVATRNGEYGPFQTRPTPAVSAFDLRTGAMKWTYEGVYPISQAAAGYGLVVFRGAVPGALPGALYVLDAATGALKYTVPGVSSETEGMPTLHREPDGDVRAYFFSNHRMQAVDLGATSGSVRWASGGAPFATEWSTPTVGGRHLFSTSPGQFYAYDRVTGAVNRFYDGGISGGGGTTPAFDPARNRLYVSDSLGSLDGVAAFDYAPDGSLAERWRYTGRGTSRSASVAVGADGSVFAAGSYPGGSDLVRLDPSSGAVLDRATLPVFNFLGTPALSDGYVWVTGTSNRGLETWVYDADTLDRVATFAGGNAGDGSPFDSPVAIFSDVGGLSGFLLDYGNVGEPRNGFDAYFVVPEPGGFVLAAGGGLVVLARRRRGGGGVRRTSQSGFHKSESAKTAGLV